MKERGLYPTSGTRWASLAGRGKPPDLPLMRKNSYRIRAPSLHAAVSNVQTMIDLLLDLL
jgi:hypothetical protein